METPAAPAAVRPGVSLTAASPELIAKVVRLRVAGLARFEIGRLVGLTADEVGEILEFMGAEPDWLQRQETN